MKRKQGISLIVLVITIIVMIILAASVVISLNNTGIINKANEAVDATNIKEVEQYSALIWAEEFMNGKRGEILKEAVLEKLKEYIDEYDIDVTNQGISVTKKEVKVKMEAGLYQTDSDYKVLLKSWQDLIDDGIITENGKIVSGKEDDLAGDLVIPDEITTVVDSSYYNCTKLTSAYVPDSVTVVGHDAFKQCSSLKSVRLPESLDSLGSGVFRMSAITSLDIPNGVPTILTELASYNSELKSVNIPVSVTRIIRFAFVNCTGLDTVTYEGTVEQWGQIMRGSGWIGNVSTTEVICIDGRVSI